MDCLVGQISTHCATKCQQRFDWKSVQHERVIFGHSARARATQLTQLIFTRSQSLHTAVRLMLLRRRALTTDRRQQHHFVKVTAHSTLVVKAVAGDQLQYWDVIEYSKEQQLRLGLVQQVADTGVQVTPLVEEEEGIWVLEEDAADQEVPVDSVLRIIDHAFGQRQDRDHNPHGEHAHDVWQVLSPVSPAVFRGTLQL